MDLRCRLQTRIPQTLNALLVAALLVPGACAQEEAPSPSSAGDGSWRILVTNDDGYTSPGLLALVAELSKIGEVVVSAPRENQSGSSHSLSSLRDTLTVESVSIPGAREAWAVDGKPATATLFGILHGGRDASFDVVVSGINQGANVGEISHFSGTVGAAMEAAYRGLPAIAVSQDARSDNYQEASRFVARLITGMGSRLPKGTVLSINVPAAATRGSADIVVRPMGGSYFIIGGVRERSSDGNTSVWAYEPASPIAPEGSDTAAYLEGQITVTPLRFDWTDRSLMEELDQALSPLITP